MHESRRGVQERRSRGKCGGQWDALKARSGQWKAEAAMLKQAANLHTSAALSAERIMPLVITGHF